MSFMGTYEDDCACIEICESIDSTYNLCYADATLGSRCSPAEKNQIILLNKISKQLEESKQSEDFI